MAEKRPATRRFWPRLIGVGLLVFLYLSVDWSGIGAVFARAEPVYLVPAAGAFWLFVLVRAYRWHVILELLGIAYGIGRSLTVFQSSAFLGYVTPGRIGDFLRMVYLKRDVGASYAAGFCSILTDRLMDLFALLAFGVLGLALFSGLDAMRPVIAGLAGAALLGAFAITRPRVWRIAGGVLRRLPVVRGLMTRAEGFGAGFFDALARLRTPRIAGPVLLSLIGILLLFAGAFSLATALRLELPFAVIAFGVILGMIVSLVPISISGLGTRDAVLILLFEPFGVPPAETLVYAAVYVGFSLLFAHGPGALLFLKEPISLKDLRDPAVEDDVTAR